MSDTESNTPHELTTPDYPSFLPPARPAARRGDLTNAWMVTFTDLIALLVAFFVLLFSMSQIEQGAWRNLSDSLANDWNAVRKSKAPKPAIDFQIKQEAIAPGTSLDYLTPVLRQQIAAQETLSRGFLRRLPGRLILSLPADLLFERTSATMTPGARDIAFTIGGVLRNLNNAIAVEAHIDPAQNGEFSAKLELGLTRAALLTRMLTLTGYQGLAVARSYGDARYDQTSAGLTAEQQSTMGSRLDVVIFDQAGELP